MGTRASCPRIIFCALIACAVLCAGWGRAEAQGPGPAGIRQQAPIHVRQELRSYAPRSDSTRRLSPALVGAMLGGALGIYLGAQAAKDPGPGEGDGLGKQAYFIMVPLGVGLGALLGHILGDRS